MLEPGKIPMHCTDDITLVCQNLSMELKPSDSPHNAFAFQSESQSGSLLIAVPLEMDAQRSIFSTL